MAQQAASGGSDRGRNSGPRMSWQAKTYCAAMLVLGGAVLGVWSIHWQGWWLAGRDLHTLVLAALVGALAIGCQLVPIRLSASYKLTLNDAIYFAALLLLGAPAAIVTAGTAAVIAHLILIAQRKRRLFDTLFNVGRCMVSIGAAGAVLASAAPLRAPFTLKDSSALVPAALVLAAVTLYVMETFPTCIAVWLLHKKNPVALWLKNGHADFYYIMARFPAALVFAITAREHALTILLLALPIACIYVAIRIAMRRQPADGATTFAEALADAVDGRSTYTVEHSKRVAAYAERLAKGLGLPAPQVALVRRAARVHDVGMVGVPEQVLLKPGRLTGEERALIDQRAQIAYELLAPFPEYHQGRELVRLQRASFGEVVPAASAADLLAAQIIAAADALDAMTCQRPYRPALSQAEALEEFRRHQGSQWHPHIVAEVERLLGLPDETRPVPHAALRAAA